MTMKLASGRSSSDPRRRAARPFHILALDPGGTTGWAWAVYKGPLPLTTFEQIEFQCGQLGPDPHHTRLWDLLNERFLQRLSIPEMEIVCESFQFRQHINRDQAKTKVELVSCEYIGVVELFCAKYEVPLKYNTASAAKTFISGDKIKTLGLWVPGKVHAMDAMRHLLREIVVGKRVREPITDRWLNSDG